MHWASSARASVHCRLAAAAIAFEQCSEGLSPVGAVVVGAPAASGVVAAVLAGAVGEGGEGPAKLPAGSGQGAGGGQAAVVWPRAEAPPDSVSSLPPEKRSASKTASATATVPSRQVSASRSGGGVPWRPLAICDDSCPPQWGQW
jgi:hypothetical protein